MSELDEVVLFARDLVRIRSVASVGEHDAAMLVADKMRSWGWSPSIEEVAPWRPNVIAVIEGGGGPGKTLLFEGHTDVVTEGDLGDWSIPPYEGRIEDGRLYGRGAADMKSGVAAVLYAARALQLAGPFPGRVVLAILVDEEGMMLGAKAFARTALAQEVDGAIIAEPEAGEICAVAKGALRLRVELHGAMAHGAMPEQGTNSLPVLGKLLGLLSSYEKKMQQEHPAHEHLGKVYLTPTVIDAGTFEQLNVIPARCLLGIDVRTIPGVDHDEIVKQVLDLAISAAGDSGVHADVEIVDNRPAVDTPRTSPVVEALRLAHESVTGQRAVFGGVPGATDGTILTRDAGIPTVVYGPGGKWIAHQANEYVDVDEIVTCTRVFTAAARAFLAIG